MPLNIFFYESGLFVRCKHALIILILTSWLIIHYITPNLPVLGQAGNLHYEAEDLRQQCVSFLQYVKVFLHR